MTGAVGVRMSPELLSPPPHACPLPAGSEHLSASLLPRFPLTPSCLYTWPQKGLLIPCPCYALACLRVFTCKGLFPRNARSPRLSGGPAGHLRNSAWKPLVPVCPGALCSTLLLPRVLCQGLSVTEPRRAGVLAIAVCTSISLSAENWPLSPRPGVPRRRHLVNK